MFRYIGNKTRLLPVILEEIGIRVPPGSTVVDLMAGTGCVSLALRKNGYRVIASDIMTYSKHHLVTQLLLKSPPAFFSLTLEVTPCSSESTYDAVLRYLNELSPKKGYFYQEFSPEGTPANGSQSRKYFTTDNAMRIDAIRDKVNWWCENSFINEFEESVLKHSLIMAINEIANISGTYGYFLANFSRSSLSTLELRPIAFEREGSINHTVLQGFAEELSKEIVADLCYIDPPYMKRQYAANYHILETIARGDFPEAVGKSGLRDWWDQHSTFCTKTRIRDSFRRVFNDMNCPLFLVSYSEDGLLSIDELETLFNEVGQVNVKSIEYARFRSNNSPLEKNLNEYIICIEKNGGF
jgi:adenine-specific DNA-methyltransferase